jgi:hypothetical protein
MTLRVQELLYSSAPRSNRYVLRIREDSETEDNREGAQRTTTGLRFPPQFYHFINIHCRGETIRSFTATHCSKHPPEASSVNDVSTHLNDLL